MNKELFHLNLLGKLAPMLINKMQMVMLATKRILPSLAGKQYLLFFALIAIINLLFYCTYPINVSAHDNPNYLAMMYGQVSNLIHASGYPAFMMVLLSMVDVPLGGDRFEIAWLAKIQLFQFLVHLGLMFYCFVISAKVFNKLAAMVIGIVWGLSTLFMSGVGSAAPEWLGGELTALSFLLSAQAFISSGNKTKIVGYVFSWLIFSCAYLVKFNSLVMFPVLALILALDTNAIRWRLVVASISGVICLIFTISFIEFFHYPSTKSRQLNFDHAWVMIASIPDGYFSLPPEQLKINSLRWKALSSAVPPNYSAAGAYCCIDAIATPDERAPYLAKYRHIMGLSKGELIEYVKSHALPLSFNAGGSAIPLYWYIGLAETDTLGIAVYVESILAIPKAYLEKIYNGLITWTAFDKQIVPFYSDRLGLIFSDDLDEESLYFEYALPPNAHPWFQTYWSPKNELWSPGVWLFEKISAAIMPRWLELLIFSVAALGIIFSPNSKMKFLGLLSFASVIVFSVASFMLLGMRHKEFITILPLLAIFYGAGLSSAYAIFRKALASKAGNHHATKS